MRHRYRVVDVFTTEQLEGNPLAVFPDATALDQLTMQKIARELNLSETTFVLPPMRPDCLARVRIFTPRYEMAFAGHPILGTSFVLLDEKMITPRGERFVLDIPVGPVPVRVEPGDHPLIWLTTPPIEWRATYDPAICAEALGLHADDILHVTPQQLSAGNPNIFVPVKDKKAVDRAILDIVGLRKLKGGQKEPVCVFVFTPTAPGAYSRMFAPEFGVAEDPATGSATGPLAAYMMRHQLAASSAATRFYSEQGTAMGRRSILHVQVNGEHGAEGIEVGGHVTPVVEATMTLDR
jgi:trans-2,3-dihydro-3-hydroxyanthranilate isomerase